METVYSGVVSIRNLRLTMFLAELNNLALWGADVGNAYLQALTREKLYIVGRPEFKGTTRTWLCHVQSTLWYKIRRSMLA